jgi:hypothetical protein
MNSVNGDEVIFIPPRQLSLKPELFFGTQRRACECVFMDSLSDRDLIGNAAIHSSAFVGLLQVFNGF